jgi:hypothetical protein
MLCCQTTGSMLSAERAASRWHGLAGMLLLAGGTGVALNMSSGLPILGSITVLLFASATITIAFGSSGGSPTGPLGALASARSPDRTRRGDVAAKSSALSREEAQPDLAFGVVEVRVHQADRLPRAQLEPTTEHGHGGVGRQEGGQDVIAAMPG